MPTTCRMGTLYIKYNHLIDLWVKFGSSKLISYVPARDPIFAKMVKKVMTSSRNLKRVIAPPYQLGTFYIKYNNLIETWVKFVGSNSISYVPASSPIFC